MPKKKILVLLKRFGSNKDMVMDNFGREIRLFELLSKKYDIDIVCGDYHKRQDFTLERGGLTYHVVPASFLNPFSLWNKINSLHREKGYDVIIPTSEPLLGIIGYLFSRMHKLPIIYEVQDNYEFYDSYKLPFVATLDRYVVRKSDFVFFSNFALMDKLKKIRSKNSIVIENGIDIVMFKQVQRERARKLLNLEKNIKLVTYTGHISKTRGIDILIEAVRGLRENDKTIFLLLSGKVDNDVNINSPFIIYRKLPTRQQLVLGLNASNVLVIASTNNEFARYSFPQKLFEYMAVNVPIVATSVGDVVRILKPFKNSLCKPNDIEDLKRKITLQLKKDHIEYRKTASEYTWEKLSKRLDKIITRCF